MELVLFITRAIDLLSRFYFINVGGTFLLYHCLGDFDYMDLSISGSIG